MMKINCQVILVLIAFFLAGAKYDEVVLEKVNSKEDLEKRLKK